MLKLLVPMILTLVGTGAGIGAAVVLQKPEPEAAAGVHDCPDPGVALDVVKKDHAPEDFEYVKLNNQFVVPIIENGRIESLIVMGLSIEIDAGSTETVYSREPKLRDVFLQIMFDHAHAGGFEGAFTKSSSLDVLRQELSRSAQRILGDAAENVLITEIARQDAI